MYVLSRMMLLDHRWSALDRLSRSSMSMIGSILLSITFNITFNTRIYLGIFNSLKYTLYPSLFFMISKYVRFADGIEEIKSMKNHVEI